MGIAAAVIAAAIGAAATMAASAMKPGQKPQAPSWAGGDGGKKFEMPEGLFKKEEGGGGGGPLMGGGQLSQALSPPQQAAAQPMPMNYGTQVENPMDKWKRQNLMGMLGQ